MRRKQVAGILTSFVEYWMKGEGTIMLKEDAKNIYDTTKSEIDRRKKILADGNYSAEKRMEIEQAIQDAEKSLENLKKFIENPFYL